MNKVITEMEKSGNEKIKFSLTEFKGKNYVDLRVYYEDDEGDWKPTKKGITVPLAQFHELAKNVNTLEVYLSKNGFLNS